MKTQLIKPPLRRCENTQKESLRFRPSSSPLYSLSCDAQLSQNANKNLKDSLSKSNKKLTALIDRAVLESLSKLEALSRKLTWRKVFGVVLAGPLAFASDLFYALPVMKAFTVFRLETKIPGWYYDNFRYFFLCLGPYLFACLFSIGIYLYHSKPTNKYSWVGCLPLTLPIAKIGWMIQVSNDLEWHQIPPLAYFGGAALIIILFWFVADDLLYVYNHKIRNATSTMDNITNNRKALPPADAVEMYATTWNKLRSI